MNKIKLMLVAGAVFTAGSLMTQDAQAQVLVRRAVVGPRMVARAVIPGPRPIVRTAVVAPVARATVVAPVARATVVAPVARATVVTPSPYFAPRPTIVTTRVRPAVVPMTPVRTAVRVVTPF